MEQVIDFSDDDLKAALRLLSDEERLGKTERSALRALLFFIIASTIMVFACLAGLLIVWFDRPFGIGLLIASVVAFIALMVLVAVKQNPFQLLTVVRQSVKNSEISQAIAARLEPSQSKVATILVGCGGGLMLLLFFPAVGWFLYDLVTTRTVNLLSLILIAVPIATVFSVSYYQMRRDFLHYSRISRLRDLLEPRTEGTEKRAISTTEVAFLRQVETRQMVREARQMEPEADRQAAESYPIIVGAKAREYLDRLPVDQSLSLRGIIDTLQFDPRPLNVESVVEKDTEMLVLREGNAVIIYRIDEGMQRVIIVDIRDTVFGKEVENAS
jgi:mRNA-degrading endonuclease RelE of RelBE toxin-antitoxin system